MRISIVQELALHITCTAMPCTYTMSELFTGFSRLMIAVECHLAVCARQRLEWQHWGKVFFLPQMKDWYCKIWRTEMRYPYFSPILFKLSSLNYTLTGLHWPSPSHPLPKCWLVRGGLGWVELVAVELGRRAGHFNSAKGMLQKVSCAPSAQLGLRRSWASGAEAKRRQTEGKTWKYWDSDIKLWNEI